ncbi:immunoglobulin-like domain-containing protein [Enterococcus rotai]|uniref:immunoglobulin-like domain-containing protein n=1 Tax=Enterococcus rotai TaxID=118060 RepID=UPI0032B4829C
MKSKNGMKTIITTLLLCNQILSPVIVFAENNSSSDKQAISSADTQTVESIEAEQTEENQVETEQSENEDIVISDEAPDLSAPETQTDIQEESETKVTGDYTDLDVAKTTITAIPRGNTGTAKTKERRNMDHSALETTGIFLPRGQEIKIVLEEEPNNLSVVIGQYGPYESLDSKDNSSNPKSYTLTKGENIISRPDSDGMVYLENKSNNQTLAVSLEGGVEIPRYVLGEEGSVERFSAAAEKLKGKVPFFEIEGNYAFGTFQMSQLKHLDYANENRLPELLSYWDQVMVWTNEVYGFSSEAGYAAKKNLNQRIHITNPDTGAGYASATSKRITFQVGTGASKQILSGLPTDDQWGLWHEIGHTYQTPYYTFTGMTEVTVNISANYIRQKVGLGDRTESRRTAIANYLNKPREEKVYLDQSLFDRLASLWTLQRVFGDDFFPTVSQEYRTTSLLDLPGNNSNSRIQSMIQMMSKAAKRNLVPYFDMWGLDATETTKKFCSQFSELEKDIWLDIAGFDDRYELPGVVPEYTIPTGKEVNASVPIFLKNFSIDGLVSVPSDSEVSIDAPQYSDIGVGTTANVKVTNENGVSNLIPITGEITGGDAVKFRGNTSAYRIIAPDAKTKTFSVIGSGSNFHGSGWSESEYASIVQYDSALKTIKNQVSVTGRNDGSDSALIQKKFDGKAYEIGDYIRINHVESHTRLDRYQKDKLLKKDSENTYWYVMTEDGWEETTLDLDVIVKGGNFTLGQKITPEELIELPKESNLEVESISFKTAPNMSEIGETTAEVLIKTTIGIEQVIAVDKIKVTGGDAVKIRGNTSSYRIITPDAKTKTFSVIGSGGNLHGSSWSGTEYTSIVQYDSSLKNIKNQVSVNGRGDDSNSHMIQKAFDSQPYTVGDYVRIYHVESHTRLDRYQSDVMIKKDREKNYWYEMTTSGWVPLAEEPEKGSLSVDSYQYGDINLTGTFSGDIKRGRLTINQQVVSWGGTFRDGQFTYYIGAGRIKEGDHAVIDFLNSEDEVVESYEIHPTTPSGKVEPATYMLGSSEIKTTFEGDVKRARLVVDNVVVSVGGTISEGNVLKYYVNPAQLKQDSKVVLQGYNSADQSVGEPAAVEVLAFDGQLTTAEYVMNGQWIKGSYEGSVKKAQLTIDGCVISSGGTFKTDGSFEYYVNPTQIKADSEVYLTPYDGSGKLMEEKTYPVTLS